MNKAITTKLINTEPAAGNNYVYLVDSERLAKQLITIGHNSIYIAPVDQDVYFSPQTLDDFLCGSLYSSQLYDYTYVVACEIRKLADQCRQALERAGVVMWDDGWKLFKNREYLVDDNYRDDLVRIIDHYEASHRGPSVSDDLKNRFCELDKYGKPVCLVDKLLVDYLIENYSMFVCAGHLYIYSGGVFVEDVDGVRIKSIMQGLLHTRMIKARVLNSLYSLLLMQQSLQVDISQINDYPVSWINFKNGMLDTETLTMHPHDPVYHSINQIPHNYAADFDASRWRHTAEFLEYSAVSQADVDMLLTYMGYCMTADTRQQVFLMLKGGGGTGKSRVIHLFEYIVGGHNTSNVSLQDLNKRFYPTNLFCKLLNSCADISSAAMEDVDVIKKITGEDLLVYERKGEDARSFRSYAKLLFSANKLPMNLDEKSNAFYRRMLIYEMDRQPEKADRELDAKLESEVEMTINRAVWMLHKMYNAEDPRIQKSENSERLVMELWKSADSVLSFLDDWCVEDAEHKENRAVLYRAYTEYCKENERVAYKKSRFFQNLQEKGYRLVIRDGVRYFCGLRISDADAVDFERVSEQEQIPF